MSQPLTSNLLDKLEEIIDLCAGNEDNDSGVGDFVTLPEILSKIQNEPANKDALKKGIVKIGMVYKKFDGIKNYLFLLQKKQELGVIR